MLSLLESISNTFMFAWVKFSTYLFLKIYLLSEKHLKDTHKYTTIQNFSMFKKTKYVSIQKEWLKYG